MRTFVPCTTYIGSAASLDDARLCKQHAECALVWAFLQLPPREDDACVIKMWRGWEQQFIKYWRAINEECRARHLGAARLPLKTTTGPEYPDWWGGPIHALHRSVLIRKDPAHYCVFWPEG